MKCPGFVIVGSSDLIVSAKAIEDYFSNVETGFKMKVITGGYHELHNEIEKYKRPYLEFLKESLAS
jgi:alpha-beta hydrolase superfamily lysophospholipase